MSLIAKIAQAILEQPPAPCDGCAKWKKCAAELLACQAFEAYVEHGLKQDPSEPTRAIYKRLHKRDPARAKQDTEAGVISAMLDQPVLAQVWL